MSIATNKNKCEMPPIKTNVRVSSGFFFLKKSITAPAGVAQWTERRPAN